MEDGITGCLHKSRKKGVELKRQEESYTTQSCPKCGHRHKPSGRMYACRNPECDFVGIRDLVGSANIKSKYENAGIIAIGKILPPSTAKYLRPVKMPVARPDVVVALTEHMSLGTTLDPVSSASAEGVNAPLRLDPVA